MAGCFQNGTVQAVHKYADFVLLLLIAALSWWLVGVDKRIGANTERIQLVAQQSLQSQSRSEEVLRRLESIDQKLVIIDQRIYTLFGQRLWRGGEELR